MKKLKFLMFVMAAVFLLLELFLRLTGFRVGLISPSWLNFKPVDSLEVYHSFYTDSTGIFRADSAFFVNDFAVNNDGFRGVDFIHDSSRTNVLLLGDSYTWGSMAEPIDSCFAGLLEQRGFNVFNTGIPGADPPQYFAVARKYIPALRPEAVCLMLYAGNDFIAADREPKPFHNLYHVTNAGWLSPYMGNTYNGSPHDSYRYYLNKYRIGADAPCWKRALASTAVGTLLLQIPARLQEKEMWQHNTQIALDYVSRIAALSSTYGARFYLFVIPLHTEINAKTSESYQMLFDTLEVHIPDSLTEQDFIPWPNGHLNNSGHKKYGVLLEHVLKH